MSNKSILLIFHILFVFAIYSKAQTETKFLEFEGYNRSYEIFIPDHYHEKSAYPIVYVLHGGGGTAKGLIRSTRARFNRLALRDSFIVVYPNGLEKSWNDGARDTIGVARKLNINDVGFFEKITEELKSKLTIDNNNIFVCGISNGGFMAQRLAFELSDKIKAIGIVAANLSKVQVEKKKPEHPVSVIFINGTDDPIVPYNGGQVTIFRKNRGKILSVVESIKTWIDINKCTHEVDRFFYPDKNTNDNCTAIKSTWHNPEKPKIKVVAITIKNGGHTWPGTKQNLPKWLVGNTNRDFYGCDEIWNFFKSVK